MLLSAHRCGAGARRELENTETALELALDMDVEYVEFDVQRCGDGTLVLYHDDVVEIGDRRVPLTDLTFEQLQAVSSHFLLYEHVLERLSSRKAAHIDLKFTSPNELYASPESTYEVAAVRTAIDIVGADNMIVTSLEDRTVKAVRQWAEEAGYPGLRVGLSLGRGMEGHRRLVVLRTRLSEFFPGPRYRDSMANLVVVNHRLARMRVASFARRHRLPMLVWTVDERADLGYWLRPGRAWMVTTNHPAVAVDVRASLS